MARPSLAARLIAPRRIALADTRAGALAGDVEAVHRARVASRRLREVLPVVAGPGGRPARHAVRAVTRALGPVRELDVCAGLLGPFAAAAALTPAAAAVLQRALASARASALQRARTRLHPAQWRRLDTALDEVLASPPVDRHDVGARAATRVTRRAAALADALDHLGTLYSPTRLHAVRVAVKQLRYALEIAGELRLAATAADRKTLRAAQDLLGEAHDLHVLAGLARRTGTRAIGRSRVTARELRRLASGLDDRCRALHGDFLARRAGVAAVAARRRARTGSQDL